MSNQRNKFAGLLAIGATILLISILIGTRLGDHVIVGADGKKHDVAVDLPTPVPISSASVPPSSSKWKKSHVVAVATDPAFPDPRLTPTPAPTPSPTPEPTPTPTPRPSPTDDPQAQDSPTNSLETPGADDGPPNRPPPFGGASHTPRAKHSHQPTSDELGE